MNDIPLLMNVLVLSLSVYSIKSAKKILGRVESELKVSLDLVKILVWIKH